MEQFWTHVWIIGLVFTLSSRINPGVAVASRKERSKDDFVRVHVPEFVREGEMALLKCVYDVDTEKLYSMKWYKGSTEFFRFTPKESPPIKTFPAFGGHVDLRLSSFSDVALVRIDLNMSDKYTCEVTKDFPDYTTSMKAGRMTVVALPPHKPAITPTRKSVSIGDTFTVNCTSFRSKPVAEIKWLLNGFPVSPHILTTPIKTRDADNKETITAGLNFTVRHQHFIRSRMTLVCQAKIEPDLYSSSTQVVIIEHGRPKMSSIVDDFPSLPQEPTADIGSSSSSSVSKKSGSFFTTLAQLVLVSLYTSLLSDSTKVAPCPVPCAKQCR